MDLQQTSTNTLNVQYKIDVLFNTIYTQLIRYKYFEVKKIPVGLWNKSLDEKFILEKYIKEYTNCYLTFVNKLEQKIKDDKEGLNNSYFLLTSSKKSYEDQYDKYLSDIDVYKKNLEKINEDNVLKTDLSTINQQLDNYMILPKKPTLLGVDISV